MVYIYPEDWSAESCCVGEEDINPHFACDDLIAPAIMLLNKKGYSTTECCAGHPYRDPYIEPAYVAFDKPYHFKTLPTGWELNAGPDYYIIQEILDDNDEKEGWEGMHKIIQLNEAFYTWACTLPYYSTDAKEE